MAFYLVVPEAAFHVIFTDLFRHILVRWNRTNTVVVLYEY